MARLLIHTVLAIGCLLTAAQAFAVQAQYYVPPPYRFYEPPPYRFYEPPPYRFYEPHHYWPPVYSALPQLPLMPLPPAPPLPPPPGGYYWQLPRP